jgi:transposase InsO family protein
MLVRLHSQATTTPKVRADIQASDEPAWVLADRHGTTEQTVYKWRHRDGVEDRSHTPHRLQTTLAPVQEAVAVALRKALLISLDDLLAVVREFLNPNASRSGLDRCLRRHGLGNLRDMKAKVPKPKHSAFKAYEPGYIHIDVKYLPQMADESRRRYLFVAIDRATRWVFIRIFNAKTAANARRFLRDLERACPIRIRTILTDNGKEFTDRLFGLRKRAATGEYEFDKLCAALNIDHRLTPPKSPQTNGMVERFNGRIEEVLQSHHFRSGEELETTLHRYVWLYNQQLPQSALGSKTPLQAMKKWHKIKPELFKKQPDYLPGCDTYADDFVILSRGRAGEALAWTKAVMTRLGLTLNEEKTSLKNARQERFDFLGYSFGPHHFGANGKWYLGASPSKKSVQRFKTTVRKLLVPGNHDPWPEVGDRLNRSLHGWFGYFSYGTYRRVHRGVDRYVYERVRDFLVRRHKVAGRGTRRFSTDIVYGELALLRLERLPRNAPP